MEHTVLVVEDEIGNLGVSLSYMASKLDDMEEYQKKLYTF